jgi:drug/metabolite transporter (DMT)-like permease
MWGGLSLGADVAFFFSAIKLTSVANATVIGALQPIVVSVVAARFFGERIVRRDALLGLVAIAGVATVVLSGSSEAGGDISGDLLSLGALFSWSAYFVFAKKAKERVSSQEYTIGAALWTGLFNIPLALAFGQDLSWPSSTSWLWLVILAFGAGLLGHSMMNWSIQQIPLWISSTFTLLIPVVSATAAWIWLGEPLTGLQIASMVVVLGALAGIVTSQTGIGRKPRPLRP